jgi:hypothetical protein
MRVVPEFLAEHLAAHARGNTLVLGHIMDDGTRHKPLFERMHASLLRKRWEAYRSGRQRARGVDLCTGNVSFRRDDYIAVGGFDRHLARSEDRELGLRLEQAGARLAFVDGARTIHCSDVLVLDVWLRRSFLYGIYDLRVARKHASVDSADPWAFFPMIHPASRALVAATVVAPRVGALMSRLAMRVAMALDATGAERAAIAGATLCYSMEYFRGVRHEAGSLGAALHELRASLTRRHHDNRDVSRQVGDTFAGKVVLSRHCNMS